MLLGSSALRKGLPQSMLIKLTPEDFVVEERARFEPRKKGKFSVYELRKRKVDTFEAIRRIASRAKVPLNKFAYAGLKDRQAVTTQLISVEGRIVIREPGLAGADAVRSDPSREPETGITFGFLGALSPIKNPLLLVQSFLGMRRRARLQIWGGGTEAQIGEIDDRVDAHPQ